MEGEEIGMVMARASELKAKFTHVCSHRCKASAVAVAVAADDKKEEEKEEEEEDEDEDEDEESSLVSIRDALDALEQQLSALQALEQQQRYERESSLFQIDRSRKILLSKLNEYKGDNLEVIHEALTFAGGTLDHGDDLLLPPYPSHLPDLFVMDDLYPCSRYKLTRNGVTGVAVQEARRNMNGSEAKQWSQPTDRNKCQGIRFVFGLLAKSMLTFVGVATVLSLVGFKPKLRKDGIQLKIQELFQKAAAGEERQATIECPPGKVVVMEEGQPRCLVKERVEIPFDLDVTAPKINYGFG